MPNVVCPQCNQAVEVPEGLAQAHCVRCGQVVPLPPISGAFQSFVEMPATAAANAAVVLPERYANWEEFRSLSPSIQHHMLNMAMQPLPDLRRIKTLPLPSDTLTQVDGWGKPLGTLEIPGETRLSDRLSSVILMCIGILLMVLGASTFFWGITRGDRFAGITVALIGAGCEYGGVWWAFMRRPSLGFTVWIFEEGLFLQRGGELTAARWDEIENYQVSKETGRPWFWLTLKDEVPIVLSVGHCPEVMPLMEYMEIRMAGSQLLPRLKAIWQGERERFGAVTLDREGFAGTGFFAPWSEVRRVMPDAKSLFVDWDRASGWLAVRYRDVSFPQLVMVISHILIEEHSRLAPIDA